MIEVIKLVYFWYFDDIEVTIIIACCDKILRFIGSNSSEKDIPEVYLLNAFCWCRIVDVNLP